MEDREKQQKENLPTVIEAIEQLMTPQTVLEYEEAEILFKDSSQQAVKSLQVNICSTETLDMAVLHKLHSQTRV